MTNVDDLFTSLNKYVTPLLNQIKFEGPYRRNYAYEFHYYYFREDIVVDYSIEIGNGLPELSINFYKQFFKNNIDAHAHRYYNFIDLVPDSEVLKIYQKSWKRIEPTVKNLMQNIGKPESDDLHKKLNVDYESIGHSEVNQIVFITSEFLSNNIDLLKLDDSYKIRRELNKRVRKNKINRVIKKLKQKYVQKSRQLN